MTDQPPKTRVVILGGGTAGWMTATALINQLGQSCDVRLIESEEIGIVGVGEATLPHIRYFVEALGIDEADFMKATHATFKLGIEFHDFGKIGTRYLHPFGSFGAPLKDVPFHHYWLRLHSEGRGGEIWDSSICNVMSERKRFLPLANRPDSFGPATTALDRSRRRADRRQGRGRPGRRANGRRHRAHDGKR